MKKIDLGQGLGILANLGVIAGILLLFLEIRQNNDLIAEEAQRARTESLREAYSLLADNGELAAIWVKETDGEELTAVEAVRLVRVSGQNVQIPVTVVVPEAHALGRLRLHRRPHRHEHPAAVVAVEAV